MKIFKLVLVVVFFSIIILACSEVTPIEAATFKKRLEESSKHTAVSWWYVGETEKRYFIAEKWPGKSTIYSISKKLVKIVGTKSYERNSGKEPINLKRYNVQFK